MSQKHKRQTTFMKRKEDVKRSWFLIDATGKTLGHLASEIAKILNGKHKPDFTPHIDTGDGVIVVNAGKITVSGNKEAQKIYTRYTGYMGGLRETPYRTMLERKPEYIITHAVKGMLPKTKLGRAMMKRLRVFAGGEHTQKAQQPIEANI